MKTLKNLIILLSLFHYLSPVYCQENEDNAQLVSIASAKTEQVQASAWLPGNVVSRLDSSIAAQQSGQLLSIMDIGSAVTKDTVIARLDDQALQLELSQLQAQQRQLLANVEYLQTQQQRMEKLVQNYSTSVSEIDRNKRDLQVAKEQMAAMAIQIKRVQLSIDQTAIKAPFSGTINEHFVSLGELINVGTPLMQLVDGENLDITVATPLNLSPYIQQVKQVQVKWADQLVELPVRTWGTAGNQQSRTFELRVDAKGLNLFAGSAVQVALPKSNQLTGITVPRDGLILRENESYVFKVDDQLVAHKVPVKIGLGVADWVVVDGDVMAGDDIVVRGGERLADGQAVRINPSMADTNPSDDVQVVADAG
ncbi:efflux RND transporter periplasmic adaptor subunit [Marinicella meishanensis]|uniref:efflux RND transporter periplasmic adaptor subunit n=1 Tax=Marinicella meishanensis TaxID=2873263 RepID=UPI001CBE2539|nr:efflux RND transporter periplasmic adaptor subunit [Marinicella sp. NBU2979]